MITPRTIHGQGGQATVESAIILPLMIFMILGIIQLTMLQQAQLMTEYAAFSACRAGIVYNGDHAKMEGAARVSLAPTVVKSSLYPGLVNGGIRQGDTGLADLGLHIEAMRLADAASGALGIPLIRIDTVHPNASEFGAVASLGPSQNELEFDDVGYYKGNSAGGQKDGFFGNESYRKALQLTIRVRYLYEMRIPFADWIIQTCWLAALAPSYLQVTGALGRESAGVAGLGAKNAVNGGNNSTTTDELAAAAAVISPGAGNGKPIVSKFDFAKLVLARQNGWYLFPLSASYTMRMQSNFYRKHLDN